MNRIDARLGQLRRAGRKGLICYITAGDGGLPMTERLLDALARAGADVVELGVPFSDPLADGAVNQKAAERALRRGTTLRKILALVKRFRRRNPSLPLVLFSYFNPLHRYGVDRFARDAARAGLDGLLVLDLPPEEEAAFAALARNQRLKHIRLVAPTTPPGRMARIARRASGFVYYVSREGVTGMQRTLSRSIAPKVAALRRHTRAPIAVGFGISTPAQARQVAKVADAVVVGSALVHRIETLQTSPRLVPTVERFARSLAKAIQP